MLLLIITLQSYMAVVVQLVVGEFELVEGDDLLHPLGPLGRAVGVDVDPGGLQVKHLEWTNIILYLNFLPLLPLIPSNHCYQTSCRSHAYPTCLFTRLESLAGSRQGF